MIKYNLQKLKKNQQKKPKKNEFIEEIKMANKYMKKPNFTS